MRFDPTVAEKSAGAAGVGLHIWTGDDLPMHLHMFEYIVRHSLLNWWKSSTAESPDQSKLSAGPVGS